MMGQRLSIILVTTSFPVEADGREAAGAFAFDFSEALGDLADLTVMAPALSDYHAVSEHFSLSCFQVPTLPLSLLRPTHPADWIKIAATLRSGQAHLNELCRARKVDHIFCLWSLPSGYWARTIKQRYGIPYSTWSLGSDIWTLGKIPVIRNFLREVLRDSAHCFADGLQLKADVEHISKRTCEFLPSSRRLLDEPLVKELKRTPPYNLAYLGRWHANKGIDILGSALEQLDDEAWAKIAAVRIAGGGPLETTVRDQVGRLKMARRPVTLEGYKDREGARELLLWADFVLIPSRIESIPVIFSDAMQARCAVIANPAGDLSQLIAQYGVGVSSSGFEPAALTSALSTGLSSGPAHYAAGIEQAAAQFRVADSAAHLNDLLQI